jgi:hypothetical protein
MPLSIANQLLADIFSTDGSLFGGTGSYIQKQKARFDHGEIHLESVRSETMARVRDGQLSYRSTLLGGCTKHGRCDAFMLGDFTECLACEGAIIFPDKLDKAISSAAAELVGYDEGSGEFQITMGDLNRMENFRTRLIDVVRI